MIRQLLLVQPVVAFVLGKAAIFQRGSNWRREWTVGSRLCLISVQFFFFFLKEKMVAAEENDKEVVSVEDYGLEAGNVSLGASVILCQFEKKSKLHVSQVLSYSVSDQLL